MQRGRLLLLLAMLVVGALAAHALLALRLPRPGVAAEWPILAEVTVVNPGRTRRENQTIIMRNGRIESIMPSDVVARRSIAHLFQGHHVLPGLIDVNVRLPGWPGLRQALGVYFLYAGVTTVRDVSNFGADLPAFQHRIDANEIPWPRLVACGQVIEGDPCACPASRMVHAVSEAGPTVDALRAAGARCVRVHHTVAPELRGALRVAAHSRGLPLVEPVSLMASLAIAGDAHELPSGPEGLRTITPDGTEVLAPTLLPWALPPAGADVTSPNFDGLGFLPRAYHAVVRRQQQVARVAACGADATSANVCSDGETAALPLIIDMVRGLHAGGARLGVGTGTPAVSAAPGFAVYREMAYLHAAGLSLDDVWVAATRTAGEALGIPQLGVLEAGAPADLLIFRDDPTRDLAALNTLEAVVMRGRLYPWQPRMYMAMDHIKYFDGWLYDWGTRAWARLIDWWDPIAPRACAAL